MSELRKLAGAAIAAAAFAMGGCAVAAGAAAGGGAVAYVQSASQESALEGGIDQASAWTMAAYRDLGIAVTENDSKDGGRKRELEGKAGNGETVHASLVAQDNGMTNVQVTAKKNKVEYDKDYARTVLGQSMLKRS